MCGILVIASAAETACDLPSAVAQYFAEILTCRGPDTQGSCQVACPPVQLQFHGSLLQLRGRQPSITPLQHSASGSVLLWNGEVFAGLEVPPGVNDGHILLAALTAPAAVVPEVLSNIRGPWALVFWQAAERTLWFGRDAIGRRSLLLHMPTPADNRLVLASTAPLDPSAPLQAMVDIAPGLYSITFPAPSQQLVPGEPVLPVAYVRHEWTDPLLQRLSRYERLAELVQPQPEAAAGSSSTVDDAQPSPALDAAAIQLLAALRHSMVTRCSCIDQPAGKAGTLLGSERLKRQQSLTAADDAGRLQPAPVLILFSGGADSTLIAALAHEALPAGVPIDLASVCFDENRSPDRLAAIDALQELQCISPGREWRLIQVDCTLADVDANRARLLQLLSPSDTCMDLNIGAALWLATRATGKLYSPEPAVALHAAQPSSIHLQDCQSNTSSRPYTSAARVVLLGHGADELLGGYGRHRTRFREGGWPALSAELSLDMGRLWQRNLGRDDRLVADHGREARHPYLDEGVIAAALNMPLHLVADLRLPPGQGDKCVLRRCLTLLGLPRAAGRAKRAIQFGSRLGQKANVRDFGGTRKANARQAGSVRLKDVQANDVAVGQDCRVPCI